MPSASRVCRRSLEDSESSELSNGEVLQGAATNTARCIQRRKIALKKKQIFLTLKGYTICFL